MYHVPLALQYICGRSDYRENGDGKERNEISRGGKRVEIALPLVCRFCVVGRFIGVCRRRGLKVSAGKTKVTLLGGEDGLGCDVLGKLDTFRECV